MDLLLLLKFKKDGKVNAGISGRDFGGGGDDTNFVKTGDRMLYLIFFFFFF